MKKTIMIGIVVFIIALLVEFNLKPILVDAPKEETNKLETDEGTMLSEYYPFLENTMLSYEGQGNEFASQDIYFEFIRGNRAQIKVKNAGTNILRVLELNNGTLSEIYHEGEFYHIEDLLDIKAQKQDILLMEPLEVGTTWRSSDGYEKKITSLDANLDTPYESFKDALEVTTVFEEERVQKDYFVKGIGLVGKIYRDKDATITTLLKDKIDKPMTQEMLVFYPLKDDMDVVFVRDTLEFTTNAKLEEILESKLKNPPDEKLGLSLPPSAVINSVHLDRSNWVAKIDFNESVIRDLNVGSSYEYSVLKSIVNTIGKFYDTEQVYISMDGRPYESGHIAIQEGETFKVDVEDVKEFK